MALHPQFLQEVSLLLMFDPGNPQEGLKVHHEADPGKIEAAKRLHELGIITRGSRACRGAGKYVTGHAALALTGTFHCCCKTVQFTSHSPCPLAT